jgi:hypothetical protein
MQLGELLLHPLQLPLLYTLLSLVSSVLRQSFIRTSQIFEKWR